MVRRWGRCVCDHPINTAAAAINPPTDIVVAPALRDGKPTVSKPRKAKHIVTVAQRYAWEYYEASRIRRESINRGAPSNPADRILRTAVYLRDAGRCQICGRLLEQDVLGMGRDERNDLLQQGVYLMSLDHIIPVSKGGTHTYANVRATCEPCNTSKSDSIEQ